MKYEPPYTVVPLRKFFSVYTPGFDDDYVWSDESDAHPQVKKRSEWLNECVEHCLDKIPIKGYKVDAEKIVKQHLQPWLDQHAFLLEDLKDDLRAHRANLYSLLRSHIVKCSSYGQRRSKEFSVCVKRLEEGARPKYASFVSDAQSYDFAALQEKVKNIYAWYGAAKLDDVFLVLGDYRGYSLVPFTEQRMYAALGRRGIVSVYTYKAEDGKHWSEHADDIPKWLY